MYYILHLGKEIAYLGLKRFLSMDGEGTGNGAHPAPKRELKIVPQSLILFDQGYPDAKLLAFLQGNGSRFPMRCKMQWNYVIDETQSDDFMLDLNQDVSLRVIRVWLPSGETETLMINLLDLRYEQFMPLYFRR